MTSSLQIPSGGAQAAIAEGKALSAGQERTPNFNPTDRRIQSGVQRVTLRGNASTYEANAGVVNETSSAPAAAPRSANTPSAPAGQPITAHSSWGAQLTGDAIRPDLRISVGGTETTIAAALTAGLIRKQGSEYFAVDGSAKQPTQADIDLLRNRAGTPEQFDEIYGKGAAAKALADQKPVEPGKVADLAPEFHTLASEFSAKTDNQTFTGAVKSVMETGALTDEHVGQLAAQMGLEPDEVRSRAASLQGAYEAQAKSMLGTYADEIIAYARDKQPQLMNQAVARHVQQEDANAYADVVKSWWLDLPKTDPDYLMSATNAKQLGLQRDARSGQVTVMVPGIGRMEWRAAINSGFFNFKQ